MKKKVMIGMASLAVLMCINFVSCSEDDDVPQYQLITNGKKITKIEISDNFSGSSSYNFKYDNTGKVIEITHNYPSYTQKIDYIWSNNTINGYSLSGGLIRNGDYREVRYSNNVGRPSAIDSPSSYCTYYNFVWNSSNSDELSRIGYYSRQGNRSYITDSYEFSYDKEAITCNNYNPIVPIFLSHLDGLGFLCVAHPELINARTTLLPNKFLREDYFFDDEGRLLYESHRGDCIYKFDCDGYMTECTINTNSMKSYPYKATYSIIWE